jgi:hypothetical protein
MNISIKRAQAESAASRAAAAPPAAYSKTGVPTGGYK